MILAIWLLLAVTAAAQYCPSPPNVTSADGSPLTVAQINDAVAIHNAARQAVNPAARSMPMLRWNVALAAHAQAYIDACPGLVHSSQAARTNVAGFSRVGENLAQWSRASDAVSGSINLWIDERTSYTFVQNCDRAQMQVCGNCALGNPNCGHYTQVVWNTTTDVGCGFKSCQGSTTTEYYFICQYGPNGNFQGSAPYAAGSPTCPTSTATTTGSTTSPQGTTTAGPNPSSTGAGGSVAATPASSATSATTPLGAIQTSSMSTSSPSSPSTTDTAATVAPSAAAADDSGSQQTAAIAGGVVGGLVAVVLVVGVVGAILWRKRSGSDGHAWQQLDERASHANSVPLMPSDTATGPSLEVVVSKPAEPAVAAETRRKAPLPLNSTAKKNASKPQNPEI